MANRKRERNTSKEHLHGARVKRKRSRLQLSNLPMDVLCSIMSQLPIKEAIRTSILSSQWKYMWCHHTDLTLNYSTMMSSRFYVFCPPRERRFNQQKFIKRVDAVMLQHSGVGVEQINIRFDLHDRHTADVNRWVKFAIASKTKVLKLELWYLPPNYLYELEREPYDADRMALYNFPFELFDASNGSHLQFLQFSSISMKLPAYFEGFINLKKLYLEDVNITDEDLQHLLSKCSLLEFLGMAYCRMLTSLRTPHPSDRLKHLEVGDCPLLHEIELNCGLTILKYRGPMISLVFGGTLSLTNICIKLLDVHTSLKNMFTELPSNLPHLETLTSNCGELERAISPRRPPKFVYLRRLRLEMDISGSSGRNADVLDIAYLLQAAPFMEKLELHMFVRCHHRPYHREDGELRSLPSHRHSHLNLVHISGFFGHKDQLELALHILSNSFMLKSMKIDPRVRIVDARFEPLVLLYEELHCVDGYKVAKEFLCKAGHGDVVDVLEVGPVFSFRTKNRFIKAGKQVEERKRKDGAQEEERSKRA